MKIHLVKQNGMLAIVFLSVLLLVGCTSSDQDGIPLGNLQKEEQSMEKVRNPVVAGQFYPSDPTELRAMIGDFIDLAMQDLPQIKGKPRMLVLPHAGYVYSGPVAAYGFAALDGQEYDTVIVVAVSHTAYFDAIHVYDGDGYKTPLGTVPVNKGVVSKLKAASDRFANIPEAESGEHSVEVMVPFLQYVLGDDFTFVSIILSGDSDEDEDVLAEALASVVDARTLVIASSDLTHYPNYDDAVYADTQTIDAILSGDAATLDQTIRELEEMQLANTSTMACGQKAIASIMKLAASLGVDEITKLKQANSGDVSMGDKDRVVGYGAIAFSKSVTDDEMLAEQESADEPVEYTGDEVLTNSERIEALQIARATLASYIKDGSIPDFAPENQGLYDKLGAFVTLNIATDLRGCIGQFEPDQPLWQVIREMTIAAAAHDTRFYPVSSDELDSIEIEISVLSPMRQISDPYTEIEVGRHGVYVAKGSRTGTYLPQVATDNSWDLETFMNSLCGQKAGIGEDDWKTGEAEIYIYSAQVFGE